VGALEEATEAVLAVEGVGKVVCLCGRNEEIRAALERRFAGDPRVRVEGFTEEMSDWLAAADVLVHSTGGLTMLEAEMRGCPAVSYGWGRGHVRLHNRAFRHFGLAVVATDPPELRAAVAAALLRGRASSDFSGYPSAASLILERAERRRVADAA
jgi:UDP-N-acetylglucosamine:LPS N-acetylglucosamine transferase